jgi:hypothetical protein
MNKPKTIRNQSVRLKVVRGQAHDAITEMLQSHGLDLVLASDIDPGSSPVVLEDPYDANDTFTLDAIRIEDGRLEFDASNCSQNVTYTEDNIPTDAILDIADWLEENEDALRAVSDPDDENEDEDEKDQVCIRISCDADAVAEFLSSLLDEISARGGELPDSYEDETGYAEFD